MNRREKKLVADMKRLIGDYDLEMTHRYESDEFDELIPEMCGWYAMMYTESEAVPINGQTLPLITDAEAKKYHVDVQKCFGAVGCCVSEG